MYDIIVTFSCQVTRNVTFMGISPFSKIQSDVTLPGRLKSLDNYNKFLCFTSNSDITLYDTLHSKTRLEVVKFLHGGDHNQRSGSQNYREDPQRSANGLKISNQNFDDLEYKLEYSKDLDQEAMEEYNKRKRFVFDMLEEWDNEEEKFVNVLFEASMKRCKF